MPSPRSEMSDSWWVFVGLDHTLLRTSVHLIIKLQEVVERWGHAGLGGGEGGSGGSGGLGFDGAGSGGGRVDDFREQLAAAGGFGPPGVDPVLVDRHPFGFLCP